MPTPPDDRTPEAVGEESAAPEDVLLHLVLAEHPSAEDRPQQAAMIHEVADAVRKNRPLVVQAGTGTGKSLAYVLGALAVADRVVVSTATKQLGEQLMSSDIPLAAEALRGVERPLDYRLLMGRGSYLCLQEVDELNRLDDAAGDIQGELAIDVPSASSKRPSSADLKALNSLLRWATTTKSGERQDAPAVPDHVWSQVSIDGAGCPGAQACPFGKECFAEKARNAARTANVVVTNHALLAADMTSPQPLFADADVVVIDEVHEAESYFSRAWGTEFSAAMARDRIGSASRKIPKSMDSVRADARDALTRVDDIEDLLNATEPGLFESLPPELREPLDNLRLSLAVLATAMERSAEGEKVKEVAAARRVEAGRLGEIVGAILVLLSDYTDVVKWAEKSRDAVTLKTAPLDVGDLFRQYNGDRLVIGTSATAAVGGDFTPIGRVLGLVDAEGSIDWKGTDVGTPFNHSEQSILYVPGEGFPEPVGRERTQHTAAVLDDLTVLTKAAGGRTLALFTTTAAAKNAAEHLRKHLKVKVLAHGDAPAAVLAKDFIDDETSVLCATMGFWSGLSVPGPSCSLVVIDKIPFAPMDDPLMSARRKAADEAGRNGFTEVFTANAALLLAQGSGRLIRTKTDKGVVAILDRRIVTKGYGRMLLRSLPTMKMFNDRDVVQRALERLTAGG